VSLCLSLVTLGVYSAWGKVRKRRYLYAHTRVDGSGFDYRASPLAILKGRAIALALFGGFALSGHFLPLVQLTFVALLVLLAPWIVVASSRFNARNSVWRNVVFGFDGRFAEAAKVLLGFGALALATLGIAYPYFRMRRARFIIERHRFGATPLEADLATAGFIVAYLLATLMAVGVVVLFTIAMMVTIGVSGATGWAMRRSRCTRRSPGYAAYIACSAYVRARGQPDRQRHDRRAAALPQHAAGARSRVARQSNIVAILATLGLATPWVTVRMARYRADNLCLVGEARPEAFAAAGGVGGTATGSEVSDLFDVDVSL
jgi:uncharacterized membrane protein YjgN (DUF898 family)